MSGDADRNLNLESAVQAWDREAASAKVAEAVEQREAFVTRFPAAGWPGVELRRYALGTEESETFSRWLEFETPRCGSIKGGSAMKHLVFKRRTGPGWYFEKKHDSEEEAWEEIRSGFAELVRLGSEGRWSEIDQVEALWAAPAVRAKTTWMYFPDQLLPIYSEQHLNFFLRIFGLDSKSGSSVEKSRRLFAGLTEMEVFAGWQPLEIMYFLYDWADPNPSHAVLKIAPGRHGHLWDDCRANGYIRIGWDETGDLALLEGQEEIRAALEAAQPDQNKSSLTRAARSLEKVRSLEDGDIVVANEGTSLVLGIGRVDGGYEFRPDLPDHRHTVSVDWFDERSRHVDFGSAWMPTVVTVKPEQYHEILRSGGADEESIDMDAPLPPVPGIHLEAERLLERTGQLIFYGPPGTGKTFSARRHAAWLLGGGSASPEAARAFGSAAALSAIENEYATADVADERPAWLLVANPQQWRWQTLFDNGTEEYDYGRLQKHYESVRAGDVVFGYEATPTKAVVAKARVQRGLYTDGEGQKKILVGDGEPLANGPSYEELQSDNVLSQAEPVVNRMQGTLFRLEPAEAARLDALARGAEPAGSASGPVPQLTRVTFHPTYSYEDFIEGYKPTESGNAGLELQMRDGLFKQVCRAATADPDRPYVVLIDEINRGNVPKIFGELITLVESDKRGVSVTLPQSGEPFMVPPNVFLIATMNTADRSIHVLDTALRRRFAFVELLPEPAVLEGVSIGAAPLDEILQGINASVREHIGREKQVGHSVFMEGDRPIASPATFALAFKYELLPLLQEYVYGDYADLALLLGDEIIDVEGHVARSEVIDDPERLVAALVDHLDIDVS